MSASSEPRVLSGDVVPRGALCSFIARKAAGEMEQEEGGCPGRQDCLLRALETRILETPELGFQH